GGRSHRPARGRVPPEAGEDADDPARRRPGLCAGDPGLVGRPRRDARRSRDPPEGQGHVTAVPQGSGRRSLRALVADNPAAILTFVFIGIFVATDIVNRAQGDGAFLTAKQVSTTFLFAAVLGLIAAGQTLVMLTGGVDLSVATTATAGAFMISRFGTHGSPEAIVVALAVGLGIGLVNGI